MYVLLCTGLVGWAEWMRRRWSIPCSYNAAMNLISPDQQHDRLTHFEHVWRILWLIPRSWQVVQ